MSGNLFNNAVWNTPPMEERPNQWATTTWGEVSELWSNPRPLGEWSTHWYIPPPPPSGGGVDMPAGPAFPPPANPPPANGLYVQRPVSRFAMSQRMFGGQNPMSSNTSGQRQASGTRRCGFCFRNGEAANIYEAHSLRERNGACACPILRKYVCPMCQATGDVAHTITYCPLVKEMNNGQSPPSATIILKSSKIKSNGKPRY